MHDLYALKDMLCKELEEYGRKELTAGTLDVVDKLAHSIKNLCKIIEEEEGAGYSNSYPMYSMDDNSYYGDSYARGRRGNVKRDSMGRYSRGYSRSGGMIEDLRDLMMNAPDERTRQEMQRFISKMENM